MDEFELEVINALRELEIPVHLQGYRFIKTALNIINKEPMAIYKVIKLYAAVAEKDNTSGSKVERGIRHALTFAFMDLAVLKKVMGTSREMTNSEFLATLHEVIKVKMATNQALVKGGG